MHNKKNSLEKEILIFSILFLSNGIMNANAIQLTQSIESIFLARQKAKEILQYMQNNITVKDTSNAPSNSINSNANLLSNKKTLHDPSKPYKKFFFNIEQKLNITKQDILLNSAFNENYNENNDQYKNYLSYIETCKFNINNPTKPKMCLGNEFKHQIASCNSFGEANQMINMFFSNIDTNKKYNTFKFWAINNSDLFNSKDYAQLKEYNCLRGNFYITFDTNKQYSPFNLIFYQLQLINSIKNYIGEQFIYINYINENLIAKQSIKTELYLSKSLLIEFINFPYINFNQTPKKQKPSILKRSINDNQKFFNEQTLSIDNCDLLDCIDPEEFLINTQNNNPNYRYTEEELKNIINTIDQINPEDILIHNNYTQLRTIKFTENNFNIVSNMTTYPQNSNHNSNPDSIFSKNTSIAIISFLAAVMLMALLYYPIKKLINLCNKYCNRDVYNEQARPNQQIKITQDPENAHKKLIQI